MTVASWRLSGNPDEARSSKHEKIHPICFAPALVADRVRSLDRPRRHKNRHGVLHRRELQSAKEKRQVEGSASLQEQIAKELNTTKSVISRMENHAKDIRLSTLEKFAKVVGRHIHVALV